MSAQVNAAIHALTICWDGHAAALTCARTTYDTRGLTGERGKGKKRDNRRKSVPCLLPCTGRRTSVCLRGLHTLSEQSSVCSRVRPELQEEQSYFK